MRRNHGLPSGHGTHVIRAACWASLLTALALVATLGFARSAQARAVLPAIAAAPALPAGIELEDEAEAGEDEEFEFEECEFEEEAGCEEETGSEVPPECLLSSASATVLAAPARNRVRLQLTYSATTPTAATISYGLHGAKGSLYLGSEKKRLAKKGVLRLDKSLTGAQMAKVMAAKVFTVRLRLAAAPRYCQTLFDRQLDLRRATPSGLTWRQSE